MTQMDKFCKAMKDKKLQDIRQQLDDIYESVVNAENAADNALRQLRDWNRDTKIQELLEENTKLRQKIYNDFTLSAEEHETVDTWQDDHIEKHHIGKHSGYWTFEFTPTELGTLGYCVCEQCKEKFLFRSV